MKLALIALTLALTGCSTYQPQPNAGHLVPAYNTATTKGSGNSTTTLSGGTVRYIDYTVRMRAAGLR